MQLSVGKKNTDRLSLKNFDAGATGKRHTIQTAAVLTRRVGGVLRQVGPATGSSGANTIRAGVWGLRAPGGRGVDDTEATIPSRIL